MADTTFDLIVIGAGMAGTSAAAAVAGAGRRVAIVDERDYGGTCPLRGCDAKKLLRRGAEVIEAARLMEGKGIDPGSLAVDWPALMAHKRAFTEAMPAREESAMESAGVTTLHGHAEFVDATHLRIGDTTYAASQFLVATGHRPRALEVPGAEHTVDSEAFLDLDRLPERILFIGGGFVSMEFAHIAHWAGAKVVVANHSDRILRGFDPELVDQLVERSRADGIDIRLSAPVILIDEGASGLVVTLGGPNGNAQVEADLVVNATGRVPNVDGLGLEAAGIEHDRRGIAVDPTMRSTSAPHVFAAGDVAATAGAPITPVGILEGSVVARNILGAAEVPDYTGIPRMCYTLPELGSVGLTEAQAKEQGVDVDVRDSDTASWYSNMRIGETLGRVKVLVDKASGKVVGAHVLGHEYADLLNVFSMAMRLGLTTAQLREFVAAYPTLDSDVEYLV